MKRALLFAGMCAALFAQQPAIDVDGWTTAKFGMSPKEVQAAVDFPMVQSALDKSSGREIGMEIFSSRETITVSRIPMKVYFFFSANRLTEVQLGPKIDVPADAVFKVLKEALISKYGIPQDNQPKSALWRFRSGSVSLASSGTVFYKKAESQPLL